MAPLPVRKTANSCPLRVGCPAINATPAKAMSIPVSRCHPGCSRKTNAAIKTANGTSSCITMTASDASIIDRPVNVSPYCRQKPTIAIQNTFSRCPRGMGTNHTSTAAARQNRRPIRNTGGNSSSPALAIVKPTPQVNGTSAASSRSRRLNSDCNGRDS